jgi:hypothetical protein
MPRFFLDALFFIFAKSLNMVSMPAQEFFRSQNMGELTSWLAEQWLRRHQDGHKPMRSDFDPIEIGSQKPEIFPHLWLLDVETAPYRFRYRLIGGAMTDAGGVAKVGDYVDTFDTAVTLQPILVNVCETGQPWFRRGPPILGHNTFVRELEALVLPLHNLEGSVNMLLNCTVYYWQEGYSQ